MPNLREKKQKPKLINKKTRDQILEIKRERERIRREKIKNNPQEYAKQKQKESERYQKRKSDGKIKLIGEMSERDKRQKRKSWIKHNRTYREKKKYLNQLENQIICDTPTPTEVDSNEEQIANIDVEKNEQKLRKRITRLKVQAYRKSCHQKKIIESLKRENRKLRSNSLKEKIMLHNRSPNDTTRTDECTLPDLTPNTKVDEILQNSGVIVPDSIRKELLFGECVKKQLNENFSSLKDHVSKQNFAKVVGGKVLKKYRVTNKLNMSKYLSTSIAEGSRKKSASKIRTIKDNIIMFYESDENSRLCAGKKECITFKKVKKQKRYMNYSLKSLHNKYLKEKHTKISYGAFCRLRPFWVLPPRVGARDTCLCITHENFRLLTTKLYSEGIIGPKNPEELVADITCQPNNEQCLNRTCNNCKETQVPFKEFNGTGQFQYQKWCTKKETRVSSKTGKPIAVQITLKESIVTSNYAVVQDLLHLTSKYMLHLRNIYHQHKALSIIKRDLTDSELLLHIDFSENYSCKYASEAQSVHFGASRQQITLHTGVAYRKDHVQSFCTISPSLRHDAKAIAAHIIQIFQHYSQCHIDTLYFLSDSPSTQYRNKTMFFIMAKYFPEKFKNINKICWSYTEAGHGKGAPDGVGATLKRTADRLVAENHDIPTYDLFLKMINENISNILIDTVDESDILKVENEVVENLNTFKGTMQVHNVTWCREYNVLYFNSLTCNSCNIGESCSHFNLGHIKLDKSLTSSTVVQHVGEETENSKGTVMKMDNCSKSDIKPDDWVAVLFSDSWYPGVVLSQIGKFVKIEFMDRRGEQFFWPEKQDVQKIPAAEILYKLTKPPIPCSARLFSVPEYKKIDDMT